MKINCLAKRLRSNLPVYHALIKITYNGSNNVIEKILCTEHHLSVKLKFYDLFEFVLKIIKIRRLLCTKYKP